METSSSDAGLELVTRGLELLRGYLPQEWEVRVMTPDNVAAAGRDLLPARPAYLDSVVEVSDGGSLGRLMVEAKIIFGPRDVDTLLGGINRTLRRLTSAEILVIAPSLSVRTRELLASSGINYLDLNGNVRIQLRHPGLFVERTAAKALRDQPKSALAGLGGPRAGRLVRALVDAGGTWTVGHLAEKAELSPGYVSKLLEGLEQEALVKRGRRGVVEQVDWRALLQAWAQNYSVLTSNTARGFIARHRPQNILHALVEGPIGLPPWAVTGSYGAVTIAPVAAPSILMLYTPTGTELAGRLDQLLLPTDESADVLIVEPADEVVFKRTWTTRFVDRRPVVQTGETRLWPIGQVPVVAPSQLAVDCLSGPGRMPAEGEALLKWMEANGHLWRAPSSDDIDQDRTQLSQMAAPW